jgi:hypothetical protein
MFAYKYKLSLLIGENLLAFTLPLCNVYIHVYAMFLTI